MVEWFKGLEPLTQAFLATIFTWGMTALGASAVFFFREVNRKVLDTMLGFAGGVMIAASYWSLLAPAIEMSESMGVAPWFPPAVGFMLGATVLFLMDKILPHLHIGYPSETAEGMETTWNRTTLVVLAITLHNAPEGLAVGVAFGALGADLPTATLVGAVSLAIGIGIQNFPEGFAVAMPLRRVGVSRFKSFWYGQLSAVVEPIAAVIGALIVIQSQAILPYALSFAAGAMIFVVVEEVIPESQYEGNTDLATIGVMLGFTIMMTLDVGLG
ncbi:MAG: ZIP family metal transporter [Candidatus Neomarinimicrobiota bacterium]|nr:ZIP family metal transporter [Candidatus Neomarinimicrobiota bacterium]